MSGFITGVSCEPGYTVLENAPLQARNTFRVLARAELLVDISRSDVLPLLFGLPALRDGRVLVLGEGSNVLLTRDWPGVVVALSATGIRVCEQNDDGARIRVEAGENWDDFVRWSLAKGYAGLENLALIPGTVGAAPIQNIGAYGVEVAEFIGSVEAYDRRAAGIVTIDRSACAFAYRDSIFKREPNRYIVTAVEFLLPRRRDLRLDYAGVREELAAMGVDAPTPVTVAEAVMRLRTRKLPNPALIGNAGSFFKNPVLPAEHAQALKREHPSLPVWPAGTATAKLPAAWFIEASGFKGLREGDAGVSAQHALVLVNHGHATGAQLWALAKRIMAEVESRFGVRLEPEPLII
ncbi:MAG TPA: UDP-N-acetylmuramate dehydrogenase [Rudaea sp.]|nr:UDP-N-acetylmuramate dehydrogenase [Rudaea sp.]